MSKITSEIFKRLNESEAVKKTYGDKPQDGKTEKLQSGKTASIPKRKDLGKIKVTKLKNDNKQAADAYANDTDKVMDKIDSKEQSDKGKIAKTNSVKAERTIKFPYGDKAQKSDSKLIKESDDKATGIEKPEDTEILNEEGDYSYEGGILKEIHNQYVGMGMEDEFFEDCINKMDITKEELENWLSMGESDKSKKACEGADCEKPVKECNTSKKEK